MRRDEPPLVGVDRACGDSDALVKLRVAASGTFRGRVAAVVGAANRSHGDAGRHGRPILSQLADKKKPNRSAARIFLGAKR